MKKFIAKLQMFLLCFVVLPVASIQADDEDRKKKNRSPVEKFCRDGYSAIGYYDEFERKVQAVCVTDVLNTPPAERYRDLVRDTTIFPICITQERLSQGLLVSLQDYLELFATIALEESTKFTRDNLNIVLEAIETQINASLALYEESTNTSLTGIVGSTNGILLDIETSVDQIVYPVSPSWTN